MRQAPGRTGLSNQELDIDNFKFKAFVLASPGQDCNSSIIITIVVRFASHEHEKSSELLCSSWPTRHFISLTKLERIDARALQYSSTLYFEYQVLTSEFHLARFRQLHRCLPLVLKQTHLSRLLCAIRAFQLDLVVLLISAVFSVGCPTHATHAILIQLSWEMQLWIGSIVALYCRGGHERLGPILCVFN